MPYARTYTTTAVDRATRRSLAVDNMNDDLFGLPVPSTINQPLLAHSTANASAAAQNLVDLEFDPLRHAESMLDVSSGTEYRVVDQTGFDNNAPRSAAVLPPTHVHRLVPSNNTVPRQTRFELPSMGAVLNARAVSNAYMELSKTDRACVIELIKRVPSCSGSDEHLLLKFLQKIGPIFSITEYGHTETIKLILPCTTDHLFTLWVDAIQRKISWTDLHDEILDNFFPGIHKKRLETQYVFRQQFPSETFADFVEEIISMSRALNLGWPDFHLIDIIMSNVAPHVRSHLTMHTKPYSLTQLRSLASQVNASVSADNRYFQTFSGAQTQHNVHSNSPAVSFQTTPPPNIRQMQCYKCHNVGHVARNCLNGRRRY